MKKITKIKEMYDKGFNAYQIAKYTGYASSYVYRVVGRINKSLDAGNSSPKVTQTSESTLPSDKNNVHAQRVRFFVKFMPDKYKKNPNGVYKAFIPDVDITCRGRIIYARCTKRFDGRDELDALNNSLGFWDHVAAKLEYRLGVVIFGRGKIAFEFLYEETETVDSALGKDAGAKGTQYKVFHSEDGKLRVTTDWSGGTPNHETHHRVSGHGDSLKLGEFINDVLDNPDLPTSSEVWRMLASVTRNQENTSGNMMALTSFVKSQLTKSKADVSVVDLPAPDYFG